MAEQEFVAAPEDADDDCRDSEQSALDAITAAVRLGAPEGWLRIDLVARMLRNVYESDLFYTLANGSTVPGPTDDPSLLGPLGEHRAASFAGMMAGAWFSLRLYVTRDTDPWCDIDNRWEPRWRNPVPDAKYREDYERFPWLFERMPSWLPDKVILQDDTHA